MPFGPLLSPLASQLASAPPPRLPRIAAKEFPQAARDLRAGRGFAAGLSDIAAKRLATVALSVLRCEGDADACASLAGNQALARAAWAAKEAGLPAARTAAPI